MENQLAREGRSVFLTDVQIQQRLGDFYRTVAQEAGYREEEDTVYDCRRILVAGNVQDAVIRAYQEAYPDEKEANIILLLLLGGPKVCAELKDNEIVIQPGFVGKREES